MIKVLASESSTRWRECQSGGGGGGGIGEGGGSDDTGKIKLSYSHRGHGNSGDKHLEHIMDVPYLISHLPRATAQEAGTVS